VAAQAHAATVLRMQAEVQTLQDQLAFARAQGGEVTATHADDVTLSAQLSKSKTLVAKLQELFPPLPLPFVLKGHAASLTPY